MADRYAGFDEFVAARGAALMRTAFLLTADRGHAEDALQEALTKAAMKWRSIHGNPEPYVRQTLYTVTIDRWRWRSRRAPESAGEIPARRRPPTTSRTPIGDSCCARPWLGSRRDNDRCSCCGSTKT